MRIQKTILPLLLLISLSQGLSAQRRYTPANVHAHNDYQQPVPFFTAHSKQVGSIEADVFLQNGDLYVAHELKEIQPDRTLEALYLKPLRKQIQKHNGTPYGQPEAKLQLLIDLKTDGKATLPVLVKMLEKYPEISANPAIQVVISGNKPAPATWSQFPGFIRFDGTPGEPYTPEELQRIPVFSDNFRKYTKWNGKGPMDSNERAIIEQLVDSVHQLHKKFRFWATPDTETSWQTLMRLKADYLGTDDVAGLTGYLQGSPANKPRHKER
ncbi:hypothetical protein GCM10023188_21660 [Pontibacter saemangeumensis]|uniref:Altered inheritance of mitochondria protein 6 n=1 Tax=Pontibacter saemangeumensis TaxID=1084525 RepID=A0ABP8LQJ5_9BACT